MQVEKTVFILSVDDVDDYNSVSEDEFNNNQLHWEVFQKIFKNANHICNNLINTKNIVFNFLSHGNVDENHSFNYLLKQSDCLNIENPEVSLTLSADSIASTKSWISREFHATSRLEDFIFNCKSKNRGAIQLNLLFDMDYENEGTLVQVGFGARIIERFSAEKNMSEVIQQVTICYGGYDEVEDEIQREPHSMGTHTFSKALLKTLQNIKAQVVEFDSKQWYQITRDDGHILLYYTDKETNCYGTYYKHVFAFTTNASIKFAVKQRTDLSIFLHILLSHYNSWGRTSSLTKLIQQTCNFEDCRDAECFEECQEIFKTIIKMDNDELSFLLKNEESLKIKVKEVKNLLRERKSVQV